MRKIKDGSTIFPLKERAIKRSQNDNECDLEGREQQINFYSIEFLPVFSFNDIGLEMGLPNMM